MVYCNITSHVPGTKDQDLLEEKGGDAFPYIIFMDSAGSVLARHEGPRTAEGFEATGSKVRALLDLKARVDKGDKKARVEHIVAQLELGLIKLGEAEVKIRETGDKPSAEQQRKIDGIAANSEVEATLKGIKSPEAKVEAGKKFYERHKGGKAAPTSDPWQVAYWNLILEHAETVKDVDTFEASFLFLKERYGTLPQAQRYFQEKEAALKKMKEEKK